MANKTVKKTYKHNWGAGTSVHGDVTIDWSFYRQVIHSFIHFFIAYIR